MGARRFIPREGRAEDVPPGTSPRGVGHADALGGIVAGCLAARDVFLAVSGLTDLQARSPYEFAAARKGLPSGLDLGTVHVVGAGGVGSNMLYFAPLIGMRGRFHIIDHDRVSASNLNRCLMFEEMHARLSHDKARIAKEYIVTRGSRAEAHVMKYSDFVRANGRGTPHAVWMMANEDEVWNTVQNNFPPLTFSAATSASWGIHSARHRPIDDACVACVLGMHDKVELKLACDEGQVGPPERRQLGVLPFFAPLAAAVALGHISDELSGGDPPRENLRMTNLAGPYPRILDTRIGRRNGCVCNAQDAETYKLFI
ncbi:MAG: ThiF family adenylyltransferase [Candidatus Thermoplasmatota archaeon]